MATITTTEALILYEVKGSLTLEEIALTPCQPHEAIVEIHATGICHSDLSMINGIIPPRLPSVYGHEGAGIVLSTGSEVKNAKPGDKVLLTFASCTICPECTSSPPHPAYCTAFPALNYSSLRPDGSPSLSTSSATPTAIHGSFFGQSSFSRHALVNSSSIIVVPPETE